MSKTKAVFIDVGWTLIHPKESIWDSYAIVISEAGGALSAAEAEQFVHLIAQNSRERTIAHLEQDARHTDSDEEFVELFRLTGHAIFELAGITDNHDPLCDRFLERFWRRDNWVVFPEVFDALEQLRARRLRLGVLSNAASELTGFLDELGLLKWFDFAVVSATEGVKKPDRLIFERALELANVDAHQALHVGDMFVEDVLGAKRLGIRTLLMDRGERGLFPSFPEATGHPPGSVEVVRDLLDVVAALDKH